MNELFDWRRLSLEWSLLPSPLQHSEQQLQFIGTGKAMGAPSTRKTTATFQLCIPLIWLMIYNKNNNNDNTFINSTSITKIAQIFRKFWRIPVEFVKIEFTKIGFEFLNYLCNSYFFLHFTSKQSTSIYYYLLIIHNYNGQELGRFGS